MTRRILGALALITTLGLGTVAAQESAVVVLRSGERVNGSVVDFNAQGLQVRVNGSDRWIGPGDLAAISFTGDVADADWNALTGGTVFVLRNGQTVSGELFDIGGTTPLRITVRNSGGDRDIMSNEIARIIWARPTNVPPAVVGGGAAGGPGVVVPGNQQWVSSGITVTRGQTVSFQSTGEIRISPDQNDLAGVTGARSGRNAAGSPLPQFPAGALIGRIGNGAPFAIGDQTSIRMPAAGILWLGINDDVVGDNAGHYNVVINGGRRRR